MDYLTLGTGAGALSPCNPHCVCNTGVAFVCPLCTSNRPPIPPCWDLIALGADIEA